MQSEIRRLKATGRKIRSVSPPFRAQIYNDALLARMLELQQKERDWEACLCTSVQECLELTD
jgi:hypothetical protein